MSFDQREFRDALGAFATGVTIITARDEKNEPVGMTASSFNSVSMDPPLVLWSVTKTAYSAPAFKAAEHFAIHVLAFDQTDVSNRFAKSGANKFGETDHSFDINNVPIIKGTASRFDCKTWQVYEGGDHWIIIGEVLNFDRSKKEGLVFAGGSYAMSSPIQTPNVPATTDGKEAPIESLLFYHLSRAYHQVATQFHAKVRASGLTLPEWRILASLDGADIKRTVNDLSSRTFIQIPALLDMIASLQKEGLCAISGTGTSAIISGTREGHDKVVHLFELDSEIENKIFGGDHKQKSKELFSLLRHVIDNSNT